MYQSNIASHYNRHYGRAKTSVLDSPSKMLLQNKRMLEDESEDEFSSNDKLDGKQRVTEQKLGRIMFLVTLAVLLGNLLKAASECSATVLFLIGIIDIFLRCYSGIIINAVTSSWGGLTDSAHPLCVFTTTSCFLLCLQRTQFARQVMVLCVNWRDTTTAAQLLQWQAVGDGWSSASAAITSQNSKYKIIAYQFSFLWLRIFYNRHPPTRALQFSPLETSPDGVSKLAVCLLIKSTTWIPPPYDCWTCLGFGNRRGHSMFTISRGRLASETPISTWIEKYRQMFVGWWID